MGSENEVEALKTAIKNAPPIPGDDCSLEELLEFVNEYAEWRILQGLPMFRVN